MALSNAARAPDRLLLVVAGVAVAGAAGVARRVWARPVLLAVAVLLAGWWWGTLRLEAFDRSLLAPEIGRSAPAEVVITGPARHSEFAIRVPAEVRLFGDRALRERTLLELPVGRSPPQGAILSLHATAEAPRAARAPGDFDERGWLARRGVHVILRGGTWTQVGRRGGIGGASDRLREHLSDAIGAGLTGERRAVLAGIVLGEDEGLSAELRDSFKASGLFHLLAVSGQNVAFLAGFVLLLGWLFGVPRMLAEVVALGAIGGYVMAVGWQPSVVRAGVAGALASLAWLLSRPRDRWHFMALGAAVLLAWTPSSLLEPGFQLSFAAVASIFLLVPRLERAFEGYPLPPGVGTGLAISIACGAATAPILWLQFGEVPLYSLVANALVSAAVAPLLAIALVAALLEPILPSATLALAWLNGWIAAYIAACARYVAELPHARVASGTAVAVLLAAPVAVLLLRRLPPWRRPLARVCAAGCRPARPRLAAMAPPRTSTTDRPTRRVPRRRAGRLDRAAGPAGRGARRPGAAGGPRRTAAARAWCPPPERRRPDASPARSHRRRGGGATPRADRPGSRPCARSLEPLRGGRARPGRGARRARRHRASGIVVAARATPPTCALARPPRSRDGGPQSASGRPARDVRRDRRPPHRGCGDRRDGAAALATDRGAQGRPPRLRRPRAGGGAAGASPERGRHLVRPRQRLRPPACLDARRAASASPDSASIERI